MSFYYWFNRKNLFEKVHDKYHNKGGKEKATFYCQEKQRDDKKERKRRV